MASPYSEALAAIQPHDRVHKCSEKCGGNHKPVTRSTRRSSRKPAPHTRRGPFRDHNRDDLLWHTTKPLPWRVRAKRRAANKRARASRKANR